LTGRKNDSKGMADGGHSYGRDGNFQVYAC
jgi:hypothetical protein